MQTDKLLWARIAYRKPKGVTSDLSSLEAANQGPVLLCPRGLLNVVSRLSTVRRWSKVGAKSNYTQQCWCIQQGCLRLANSVKGQRRGRWRHWEPVMSIYWQFFPLKYLWSLYTPVQLLLVFVFLESISDMVYVLAIWNMVSYFGCENFSLCTICKNLIVPMKLSIYD